jgi:hypothetical protein
MTRGGRRSGRVQYNGPRQDSSGSNPAVGDGTGSCHSESVLRGVSGHRRRAAKRPIVGSTSGDRLEARRARQTQSTRLQWVWLRRGRRESAALYIITTRADHLGRRVEVAERVGRLGHGRWSRRWPLPVGQFALIRPMLAPNHVLTFSTKAKKDVLRLSGRTSEAVHRCLCTFPPH